MKEQKFLSEELIQEGIRAFLTGATIAEIKELWGIGRNKTVKILKSELGIPAYKERAKKTSIEKRINAAIQANKGSKHGPCSEERREKISKANKGKIRSSEARKKISNTLKSRYKLCGSFRSKESYRASAVKGRETKIKNGSYKEFSKKMSGRKRQPHTEDSKKKISESKRRFYQNGGKSWIEGKKHSDNTRKKLSNATSEMWESGRFDNGNGWYRSQLEKNVFEYLCKYYTCHHSFRIKRKIYDIFVEEFNLLIEVNGDYWHFNPSKYDGDYYDDHRETTVLSVWKKDEEKIELARSFGYNICTLWQQDLSKNFEDCIDNAISKFIGGSR